MQFYTVKLEDDDEPIIMIDLCGAGKATRQLLSGGSQIEDSDDGYLFLDLDSDSVSSHQPSKRSFFDFFSRKKEISMNDCEIHSMASTEESSISKKSFFMSLFSSDKKNRSPCNRVANNWMNKLSPQGPGWLKISQNKKLDDSIRNPKTGTNLTTILYRTGSNLGEIEEDEKVQDEFESIADSMDIMIHSAQNIADLVNEDIEMDLHRTYPHIAYFQQSDIASSLGKLLRTVSIEYPEIGYVQGMNYVMAQLLFHCKGDEILSLQLFKSLMEDPKYNLFGIFAPDFPVAHALVQVIQTYLRNHHQTLLDILEHRGLGGLHFCFAWILTLFSYTMPFEVIISIWDAFFHDGWVVVVRLSVAILTSLEAKLRETKDIEECANLIRQASTTAPSEEFMIKTKQIKNDPDILEAIDQANSILSYLRVVEENKNSIL